MFLKFITSKTFGKCVLGTCVFGAKYLEVQNFEQFWQVTFLKRCAAGAKSVEVQNFANFWASVTLRVYASDINMISRMDLEYIRNIR